MNPTTAKVLVEVSHERNRQRREWGGRDHDDTHGPNRWCEFIVRHIRKMFVGNNEPPTMMDNGEDPESIDLLDEAGDRFEGEEAWPNDPVLYRKQLVRVAALAVAAIETHDRKLRAKARRR
jgi:hypothetical protein